MIEQCEKSSYPFSVFLTRMQSSLKITEINKGRLISFKNKPWTIIYMGAYIFPKVILMNPVY